ncbi:hypothetical protein APX70_00963 [Pseudomonas syringae pv. maculicola]|uniref:Uncharacterized protein n=1 Tax=Pseudomonas syringae pv. maculicola TaxID=59511 RepID=A0A3M3AB82_PSEYM|nr:hypothetical protein APX70_00963 [Pseudomonas syringae pv. maculicola]
MNGGTSDTKTGGICRQMRGANTIHLHLRKDKGRYHELKSRRKKSRARQWCPFRLFAPRVRAELGIS